MNKKEEKIQVALGTCLQAAWQEYLRVMGAVEGLQKEIDNIKNTTDYIAPQNIHTVKLHLLCAQIAQVAAHKQVVYSKARIKLLKVIKKIYGKDITIRFFNDFRCTLENGITLTR